MQDSNLSVNRLNELSSSISEARDSLNNWHDKKTEALIRLDAFTYDLQLLEEEKLRTNAVVESLKRDIKKNEASHQLQIDEITDQMQLLKLDHEVLKNEIRALENEKIEIQASADSKLKEEAEKFREEIRGLESQKFSFQAETEQNKVKSAIELDSMRVQLDELAAERNELIARTEKYEAELAKIRAQVLNVLKNNESTASEIKKAVEGRPQSPLKRHSTLAAETLPQEIYSREVEAATFQFAASVEAKSAETKKEKKDKANTDLSMQEVKKLRAVETEPATVEEYLKRLGY